MKRFVRPRNQYVMVIGRFSLLPSEQRGITDIVLCERVRTHAERARLGRVSPHKLRHSFATHLVREGVGLVTLRDLLGHAQLSSTQLYLHVTARDLRAAAERHPIARLAATVERWLSDVKLPMQHVKPPPAVRPSALRSPGGGAGPCHVLHLGV